MYAECAGLILALHGLGQLGLVGTNVLGPGLDGALVAHPDVLSHLQGKHKLLFHLVSGAVTRVSFMSFS